MGQPRPTLQLDLVHGCHSGVPVIFDVAKILIVQFSWAEAGKSVTHRAVLKVPYFGSLSGVPMIPRIAQACHLMGGAGHAACARLEIRSEQSMKQMFSGFAADR